MAEQKEKTKISETAAAKERKQSNVAMVTNRRQNFKSTKKTTKPNSKKNTFISQSVESQIKIKDYKIGKSDHVVNLKNPFSQKFDQTSTTKNSVVKQLLPNPPKPLRSLPKKTKKIEVNLISNSSDLRTSQSFFKSSFDQNLKSEIKTTPSTIDKIEEEIEDIFAPPREYRILSLNIPKDWYKRVTVFIIFSLLLILPLQALTYYQGLQGTKDRILLATNEAIENLKLGEQAVVNLDLADAGHQFDQAESNFNLAQNEINALNSLTTEIIKILPAQRASMATGLNLLKAGQIVSAAGQSLINDAKKLLTSKSLPEYYQALAAFNGTLQQVIINFRQAKEYLEKVNPADLPPQHQQDFEKVLANLPKIENSILNLYQLNKAGLRLLGQEQWQRYMLVFLNNNELRATGGFMGSFGLIDIDRGEIKDLEIPGGGTYDIQGQLTQKVIAPEPLHLINPRWEFQDANWWPDYPTTAKKIQWFYQNASNPSVDGVITITSTLMERLLDIFGPIPMPEYGREITSQNFTAETQKIVELEYDKKENRPKQFIADLAPILLEKIFAANDEQLKKLFATIITGLNERQLMVYFNDSEIQNIITQFGWSGELRSTAGDYLSVVHTNIAGGKTDGVIKETIQHTAQIQADGSIIDTVKLIRRHTGVPKENIFTGVQNNSYVRFYVPLGSVLIEASGFKKPPKQLFEKPSDELDPDTDLLSNETDRSKDEATDTDIYRSFGKTVFGNWLQLKPGEIQEATIKYRLPFTIPAGNQDNHYYSLLVQKQAGSLGSELKSNLNLTDNFKPLAKFPSDLPGDDTGVNFNSILTTDQFYGVVLVTQ